MSPSAAIPMPRAFTRSAIRRLDQLAVRRFHIPSIVLMENAGAGIAACARAMLRRRPGPVAVYCGPGNNGGDGLVIARHLHNAGADVSVILASGPRDLSTDAAINLGIARAMRLRFVPSAGTPTLVIDALLGTGIDRPVTGTMARLIDRINTHRTRGARVLSVDLPSGMDADTGSTLGIAVRADVTATLCGWKAGFLTPSGKALAGRIRIVEIGAPVSLMNALALSPVPTARTRKDPISHRR